MSQESIKNYLTTPNIVKILLLLAWILGIILWLDSYFLYLNEYSILFHGGLLIISFGMAVLSIGSISMIHDNIFDFNKFPFVKNLILCGLCSMLMFSLFVMFNLIDGWNSDTWNDFLFVEKLK